MKSTTRFSTLLQAFFTQRLMQQKQVSSHTIDSYRDTFRLLLKFIQKRRRKQPASLLFEDIDAPLVCAFLDDLETQRGISARSRNVRLAAIRSFFKYAAFEVPSRSEQIQRVLVIPSKRYTRTQVGFLTRPEIDALLAAPDTRTWSGRRDHALLLTTVQTGMRSSEMTGLKPISAYMEKAERPGAYLSPNRPVRSSRRSCKSPPEQIATSCFPMRAAVVSVAMACVIFWQNISSRPARFAPPYGKNV
jgi:site-specific recombinase XerD